MYIRDVRVPDKFRYPSSRVLSTPEIIGYPAATSNTRINRITVAASDIRINRACDATRAFDVIGKFFRKILRMIDKVKKFRKFVSTKNL